MIKIYRVWCRGRQHRIGLGDNGTLHALDCDLEEEETLAHLGDEPSSGCFNVISLLRTDLDRALSDGASCNDLAVVKLALACRAGISKNNYDAFFWAVSMGHTEIVEHMIEQGVYIDFNNGKFLIEAAEKGRAEIVRILLKNGADARADKERALYNAVYNGDVQICKLLINAGSSVQRMLYHHKHLQVFNSEVSELLNHAEETEQSRAYLKAIHG